MSQKSDTSVRSWVERAVSELERAASDQRTYRVLEAVAVLGSVAALLTTYFMIGRGAVETNPVTGWLLSDPTSGSSDWYVVAIVGLLVVVASFEVLRRARHHAPRYVLVVGTLAAAAHFANGLNDLYILSVAWGGVDTFPWWNAKPFVAFTLLLATALLARHVLFRAISRISGRFTGREGRAVGLVFLLVLSIVAIPLMGGLDVGPVEPDHGGTVSAEVENASLVNTFDTSGQDVTPRGAIFNDDGTKMYVSGSSNDNVYEYDLSTAYDISTASHTQTKDLSSEDGNVQGIKFNDDGTKMYMVGYNTDRIYEYDLSTAYDVSTASVTQSKDISSEDGGPRDVTFGESGTKMYLAGYSSSAIYEYDLSTAYDVSTASLTRSMDTSGETGAPMGVEFNGVGSKMFVTGNTNDNIYEYDLSTNHDISTASHSHTKGVGSTPQGIEFKPDGGRMYVVANGADRVEEYDTDISGFTDPVSGQVTDKDGNPKEGVAVGADHPDVASTTTNSTGYYELAVPDPATYDITADDGDYVSTKSVDVPSGGISGVDFALGPGDPDGQSIGLLEDDLGFFPADDTEVVVYERSTEYKSIEDGMSVETWHETTWSETDRATFNWENRTRVDLVNGRYYRLELVSSHGHWEDSGFLYNDTEMSGETIWLEPDTSSTDTNGDGTSGGSGSSGGDSWDDTGTPTPDENGDFPTATEQQGFGPTALGKCTTLDGQDGVEVEYWDPNYETAELEANLTVDDSTTYYVHKVWDDPRGYYRGCIADSMTDNASSEGDLGLNHSALDADGEVLTSGSRSFSAPTFGPTGAAPESTAERAGLLAAVLGALGVLWFGGNRYVPASSVKSWPSESVSPAFAIGGPVVAVLGLDLAGGGVISAGVATGLAQIAPFAGIVGVTVGGYYALRWIRAPPST